MKITVLTIFPELFTHFLKAKLNQRAEALGILHISVVDLRGFTHDKHRVVDDSPYGGGSGMVMKADPIFSGIQAALSQPKISSYKKGKYKTKKVVCFTPRGNPLVQAKLKELSTLRELVLICGRYEGVDERVFERVVDDEISLGDFVVQGGELPAMLLIEGISRLLPGYLGKASSLDEESFENGLLEYPQYTRPPEILGMGVPEVLLSGDHGRIRKWRHERSLEKTANIRPDLFAHYEAVHGLGSGRTVARKRSSPGRKKPA